MYSILIQVLVEKSKYNDPDTFQKNYDNLIYSLQIDMLKCSNCHKSGCLVYYGKYTRHVRLCGKMIEFSVQRVKCTECGRTHAILVSVIVPFFFEIKSHCSVLRVCYFLSDDHTRMGDGPGLFQTGATNPLAILYFFFTG